eukprot:12324450-Ditylum_brightwellii.AAC.1
MERKKKNSSGECQDNEILNATKRRSVLYDSAKSNDGKEVDGTMLLNDVDNSVDDGNNHLTHLAQVENNDGVDGCKKFKHIVENNSESLIPSRPKRTIAYAKNGVA